MIRNRILRLLAGIAVAVPAALLLGASPAAAHPMPHSVVLLDVHETSVTAHLQIPLSELSLAGGLTDTASYLAAHIKPTGTDGAAWTVEVGDTAVTSDSTGAYQELDADVTLSPPAGGDVRHFTLAYDVVVHQVVTHTALVSVREDWAAGQLAENGGEAVQVGTIGIDNRTLTVPPLTVDLDGGSAWSGFVAMAELGGRHILEGTDHLLFLLILLLPAPLLARGGRWRAVSEPRTAIKHICRTTVAFTIGHSAALAVTALTRLDVPAWPVEAFIALSILVGAVHAIRPIFPGREASVAALFGLGHGMAFSFTLAEMQLSTGRLVLSLFGFNLGIELVQLIIVALTLPALVVIAGTRFGPAVRVTGAILTGVAATGWLADRLGLPNPVATVADILGTHTTPTLAAVTIVSAVALGAVYTSSRRAAA
ncbi:HupE/UreJ family protein [Actinoplanes couchii]|uniref:Membrane protein n=1 Tax=Actinoplanes couchii TaxID=403638 RepID=A0ABQ3XSH7_9ACTN|nr:HupE/UreJ family protein [Actinoplanes couchii]MDR6320061.1 hypothetical protein [Actinoplanes couchii]GID61468.1 membrane protein [Actinoplanes couchii]